MTIAAVGFGPLGLPRDEFSGFAAVVETQCILLRFAAADAKVGPLTLFEVACAFRNKKCFRENLPDPSNRLLSKDIQYLRLNELTGLK